MKKLLVMVGVLACASAAAAQSANTPITLTVPKPGDNNESYQTSMGAVGGDAGKSAQVQQKVNLTLPQATGLHLTVNSLDFNIADISKQDGTWKCVYGTINDDTKNVNASGDVQVAFGDGWGQSTYMPLGTAYVEAADFGSVYVTGGDTVTSYPPIAFTNDKTGATSNMAGNLKQGSKNHFMCYRVFRLQKFSNLGNFDLTVTRQSNPNGNPKDPAFQLYMQDDPCYLWNSDGHSGLNGDLNGDTPLLEVKADGNPVHLIPVGKGAGTTGALAATNKKYCWGGKDHNIGKSWLDDAIVVAVKVDGDKAGMNTANLTYTLSSSANPFGSTIVNDKR